MSDDRRETENSATTSPADESVERAFSPAILDIDHVYEALGHSRRRYLCYTLLEDSEWSLTDLAAKIAAWENDIDKDGVTDHQRDHVYISLYHAHVPKLVDEGVISFDGESETITAADHADQVLAALKGIGASLDANQEAHARGETE